MAVTIHYMCVKCKSVHIKKYNAEGCCAPDVVEVSVCTECDTAYLTDDAARACNCDHECPNAAEEE